MKCIQEIILYYYIESGYFVHKTWKKYHSDKGRNGVSTALFTRSVRLFHGEIGSWHVCRVHTSGVDLDVLQKTG